MKIKVIDAVVKNKDRILQNQTYVCEGLRSDTEIEFAHIEKGFPSIECDLHAAFNKPQIISAAINAEKEGCDGVFINCFDDPGVYECRELLSIPVFGGYVPAMMTALSLAERIAVITTDHFGILSEERKARLLGISERVATVVPVEIGVLALRDNSEILAERVADICNKLYNEERVGAACLGCTGMHYIIDLLHEKLAARNCPIMIIEPLRNGVRYCEHIISMHYQNAMHVLKPTAFLKGYVDGHV